MTINKISGGNFGGIRSVMIDLFENVTDEGTITGSAIDLPIREGSTSVTCATQKTNAGPVYEIKLQGFSSGIDETNKAGFEGFNNRKVIAWFEDYHGQVFALGNLTEPARMVVDFNIPSDHKNAAGFQFTITSRQTVGLTVL